MKSITNTTHTENQLKRLKQNLSTYGLYPANWNLKTNDFIHFEIQSINDSQIVFIGKVNSNNVNDWQSLELINL